LDCTIQKYNLMSIAPTQQAYSELTRAYNHFNKALFKNKLPPCLITMQRNKRAYGHFSSKRYKNLKGKITDEIALNPQHFRYRPIKEVLSTLVHEMVHLWQYHFGKPGRRGYHNKQWAKKMIEVGLIPSHTGDPDGNQTGENMTHYIDPKGSFITACRKLITKGFKITWADYISPLDVLGMETKKETREKYTCPSCGVNAWAKYGLLLICGRCEKDMWARSDLAHPMTMLD